MGGFEKLFESSPIAVVNAVELLIALQVLPIFAQHHLLHHFLGVVTPCSLVPSYSNDTS
jgi:hypothetical protein